MIYIEDDSATGLPQKYHVSHNFCVQIYDMLEEILTEQKYAELLRTEFEITGDSLESVDSHEAHEFNILDFLLENNNISTLETVLIKRLLTSITGDLLSFLYEGLSCSMRGKTIVAYANLRKPLKDSLILLEMILINPTEFIQKYYINGDPNNYDPSNNNIYNKEDLIEKVLSKLGTESYLDKEIIYSLRFDKSNSNSFDSRSNLALHIVTKDKNYKTGNRNLNFIFSTEEDLKKQWDHIYFYLPYLLVYTLRVVDEIVFSVLKGHEETKEQRKIRIMLLMIYWTMKQERFHGSKDIIDKLDLGCTCKNCGEKSILDLDDLELYFDTGILPCTKCYSSLF